MTPVAQVQRSSNPAWISDSLQVKIIKRDLGFLKKEKSYSNRNTNRPSRACKHKERRRRMKEAKKPLNRRIPRAAERGERSRKAEGGEWSLPNGHLPFRRTSAAGSMAAPHFHDRVPPSPALLAGASSAFTLASSLSPHAHAARAPLRLAAAPRVAHLCAVLESAIFFHGRGITVEMTAKGELDEIAFRWDEKTELLGICERGRQRVSRAVSFFPSSSFSARGFFRLWRVPRCGKG